MEERFFCDQPFNRVEITINGGVSTCCPAWLNDYMIGNYYQDSFEEIWNGEKAQELRKSILDGSYRYCNKSTCMQMGLKNKKLYPEEVIHKNYTEICLPPKEVVFSHDLHCNVHCIMCRDSPIHNSHEEAQKLDDRIETVFLPMCANADIVRIDGAGEALASAHSRTLIARIAEVYPEVRFIIHSNGLLLNKKNLESLGIINRIMQVNVSLHASTERTYNKIVKYSNFNRVLENLDFIYREKIAKIVLSFVVSSINYKEMIPFIELAKRWDAVVSFWGFWRMGVEQTDKNYKRLAIFEESHPRYNRFVSILHNDGFKDKKVNVAPGLSNLERLDGTALWLKYRVEDMKVQHGFHRLYRVLRKVYAIFPFFSLFHKKTGRAI